MADAGQGWWSQRTRLERYLVAITTAVSIACVILVAVTVWCLLRGDRRVDNSSATQPRHGLLNKVCLTRACIDTASQVLAYIDSDAEPCDDFYAFACGRFMNETAKPVYKVSPSTELTDRVVNQLRVVLEQPIRAEEPRPFRLAKQIYRGCLNMTLREANGLASLKEVLKGLGGWPVVRGEKWDEGSFEWKIASYKLSKLVLPFDYLFLLTASSDFKNSSRYLLSYRQADLGLNREFLIKGSGDATVVHYYQTQIEVAVELGAARHRAIKELKEVLLFETALAAMSVPAEQIKNMPEQYNIMTLNEMQAKYPSIPWLEYTTNLLQEDVHISGDSLVNVVMPSFIAKLELLLNVTSKRVLANYLLWRATFSLIPYSNKKAKGIIQSFIGEQKPKQEECTNYVINVMREAAGAMYIKYFLNKETKQLTIKMVNDIRQSVEKVLREVDWMDETTRQKALNKMKAMAVQVAYPDELLDEIILTDFYKKLEVNEVKYLESVMNVNRFITNHMFSVLYLPRSKTDWFVYGGVAVVNAAYAPTHNTFIIPAGILQGRFFGRDRPEYMNYGGIGSIMAHEITHGFDNVGRQFDDKGNLNNWWDPVTERHFYKKASCMVEQYGNFREPQTGMMLQSTLTMNEDIADNGGIKQAYLAYTLWLDRRGTPEPLLPGLEWLEPNQMFWVAAAQIWCTTTNLLHIPKLITTDEHSPEQFRVNGPFANNPDFVRDFNCPTDSPMNPKHKCQVW